MFAFYGIQGVPYASMTKFLQQCERTETGLNPDAPRTTPASRSCCSTNKTMPAPLLAAVAYFAIHMERPSLWCREGNSACQRPASPCRRPRSKRRGPVIPGAPRWYAAAQHRTAPPQSRRRGSPWASAKYGSLSPGLRSDARSVGARAGHDADRIPCVPQRQEYSLGFAVGSLACGCEKRPGCPEPVVGSPVPLPPPFPEPPNRSASYPAIPAHPTDGMHSAQRQNFHALGRCAGLPHESGKPTQQIEYFCPVCRRGGIHIQHGHGTFHFHVKSKGCDRRRLSVTLYSCEYKPCIRHLAPSVSLPGFRHWAHR